MDLLVNWLTGANLTGASHRGHVSPRRKISLRVKRQRHWVKWSQSNTVSLGQRQFCNQGMYGSIWRHFWSSHWEGTATGIQWVKAWDGPEYPIRQRTAPNKDELILNVSSAELKTLKHQQDPDDQVIHPSSWAF